MYRFIKGGEQILLSPVWVFGMGYPEFVGAHMARGLVYGSCGVHMQTNKYNDLLYPMKYLLSLNVSCLVVKEVRVLLEVVVHRPCSQGYLRSRNAELKIT